MQVTNGDFQSVIHHLFYRAEGVQSRADAYLLGYEAGCIGYVSEDDNPFLDGDLAAAFDLGLLERKARMEAEVLADQAPKTYHDNSVVPIDNPRQLDMELESLRAYLPSDIGYFMTLTVGLIVAACISTLVAPF